MLEVIQIQEQQCDHAIAAVCLSDSLAKPVVEKQTIGQAGEKVMFGQVSYLRRQCARCGYIAKDQNVS